MGLANLASRHFFRPLDRLQSHSGCRHGILARVLKAFGPREYLKSSEIYANELLQVIALPVSGNPVAARCLCQFGGPIHAGREYAGPTTL